MSRRKLKKERELVADIRKAFNLYHCSGFPFCTRCPLEHYEGSCELGYVEMLLKNHKEDEE